MIIALIKWDNEKSRYVKEVVEAAGVIFSFDELEKGLERFEITPRRDAINQIVVKCIHGSLSLAPAAPNSVVVSIRELED